MQSFDSHHKFNPSKLLLKWINQKTPKTKQAEWRENLEVCKGIKERLR